MKSKTLTGIVIALVLAPGQPARATETENLGIHVLPAPGPVKVDGKTEDWDLTGGIFASNDAENLRDKLACWFHLMYDKDNLYLLARWIDETPLNNPGSTKGDYGFSGDSLQVRIVTCDNDKDKERATHLTAWRDRDGVDVLDLAWGKKFDQGGLKDGKTQGGQQAFRVNDDKKGYVQEIALPWKLLAKDGFAAKAGDRITITLEPNFGTTAKLRISLKDIFRPGVLPDRVFTFMANTCWGYGTLEAKGGVEPQPVRLADAREFAVKMEKGVPVVDWTGLIKAREMKGFKTIAYEMPADGYISVQIVNAEGQVVRQLLNGEFATKGKHETKWDGLSTPNWRQPGDPAPAGEYKWRAITHTGIGLRLKGFACNGGSAPWDDPSGKSNWGGDHGTPVSCAADGDKVYLGWSGAEAGKAIVACNSQGAVQWRASRGGISGAELMAVDGGTVYSQNWDGAIFRLDARTGGFTDWAGSGETDLQLKDILGEAPAKDERASALHARDGKLYVGFQKRNLVVVVDGKTGKQLKKLTVPGPVDVEMGAKSLYVVSDSKAVLAVDPESGEAKPVAQNMASASGIALDGEGNLYVGVREPDNQVKVLDGSGKELRAIGIKGGRPLLGRWNRDGLRSVQGMTIDAKGQLWVMENDGAPKRVSVWDAKTGKFVREFFGPTSYGALGGAICPTDANVMVGQGCEWKLDPQTGRGECVAVITRDGMENSRFGTGANGRLYLAVAPGWIHGSPFVSIYERVGDADYRLRSRFIYEGKDKTAKTIFWADENGDGQRQPNEDTTRDGHVIFSSWYMSLAPDLTLYSGDQQFKVAGFTACGAPKYDLAKPVKLPAAGLGSADGRLVLTGGEYGAAMSWNICRDIATGKEVWRYPDNFVGVHGSHKAVPPEPGMIRGSFTACGVAKLPDPIGDIWVIPTNVGEWHVLTGEGYYLTRLFQPDSMKVAFPESGEPGAILDNAPPGLGGEDFGGAICLAQDGKLYLQAGKTGFWNVEVVGLDTVKAMPGGTIAMSAADVAEAGKFKAQYQQEVAGVRKATIAKKTVAFAGDLDKDFAGAEILSFKKQDAAAVRTAATWADKTLYLGWEVHDDTPWTNGATAPEFMYATGDTVDFQVGAGAPKDRADPVLGDLRLSIGNLQGKPVAVIFRPKAEKKNPKKFFSGLVRDGYEMEAVDVVADARIEVKVDAAGKRYVVEAAVPLAALGLQPKDGLILPGDFGVTHGDKGGKDTALRTYWSNQNTGLVNDEVFELKLEPKNWGELMFK